MKKRIISLLLALALVLSILPSALLTASADEPSGATVSFTLSNDGIPVIGADEDATRLSGVTLTVPYFDLALYGMEDFYRYEADSFENGGGYIGYTVLTEPTVLHLYIYALERFYYGVPAGDCGKGADFLLESYGVTFGARSEAEIVDEVGLPVGTGSEAGLEISGSATSMYCQNFWGHDENLMYFVNHAYPLMAKGWGATADYLLLTDGDVVDVAMFTDYSFYFSGAFAYMEPETAEIKAGEELTLNAYGASTSAGFGGESLPAEPIALCWAVYPDNGGSLADGEISDPSETFTHVFDEPGEYTVIGYDPSCGSESACIAPAVGHVTVTENVTTVSFDVTPADAVVFLTDSEGTRSLPDADGIYTLQNGAVYGYTVTKNGYVGQKFTFTAGESGTITVVLTEAPENAAIDSSIYAQWANFRNGENHLGITASATPYDSADAELLWAVKYGTGWSAAPGSPIMVDGCIITYVGTRLLKLDRETGAILAEGAMAASSSFSIVPPTYADGMIFIGLSGGRIQAFNADTMESLWVYTDPLGGQPNCPITYKDGYLYAGFWQGETGVKNFVCLSATDEDPAQTAEEKLATWTYAQKGGFYWAGAYASEKFVVVGTDDGVGGYTSETASLLVFDRLTGELMDSESGFRGDIRSNVSYDLDSNRVFFTTKGGQLCNAKIDWTTGEISDVHKTTVVDANGTQNAMSTCTPSVYNGRIYIGVSGTSQFTAGSGHAINVYTLAEDGTMTLAYSYPVKGYPQTSTMLTTAYVEAEGYVYIYLPYNYTPGGISVLKDQPGQTQPLTASGEDYSEVFTPEEPLAQYCICSTIADEYGTIYYKNDSAYMMAITSKILSIEVAAAPQKLRYDGEVFDPTGLRVVAKLANGMERDITGYVTWQDAPISDGQTELELTYTYGFDSENYGIQTKTVSLPVNPSGVRAEVALTAQAANGFLLAPQTQTVSSVLAEDYGYIDQIDLTEAVSALDVLVRAHELVFGDDFNTETARTLLDVNSYGSISTIFGVETVNCGFTVNELSPTAAEEASWGGYVGLTLNETPVAAGDDVSFFLYQDDYAMDLYTWFEQGGAFTRTLTAEARLPFECTVRGYYVGWYGCNYRDFADIVAAQEGITADVADAQLALVDLETGELTDLDGCITDEDGRVSLTFPEAGTYTITAYVPAEEIENYATPVLLTLATVTVGEHTHSFGAWEITTPADCTTAGEETRTCVCGETETRELAAAGHSLTATAAKPATCTEEGNSAYWHCAACEKYFSDAAAATEITLAETVIAAAGHTPQLAGAAPATSYAEGYTGDTVCSVCGEVLAKGQTIPVTRENSPAKEFDDVDLTQWYLPGVDYMLDNGLMIGVGGGSFNPAGLLTRGEFVTVLYRTAKEPSVSGLENPFTDVQAGSFYADAVLWAAANGVVKGVSETEFAPDAPITREQLATILFRYEKAQAPQTDALAAFPDANAVSAYAKDAMNWAVAEGILNGTREGSVVYLDPTGNATRAQMANLLMRYLEK